MRTAANRLVSGVAVALAMVNVSPAAVADGPSTVPAKLHYPTGKPLTRWWWFASQIRKPDITVQLEWLKANGFGGVEIAWLYPPRGNARARDPNPPDAWQKMYPGIDATTRAVRARAARWLSPEWSELVAFAKVEADRLGLACDFTFGSGWPFGDSQVPAQDATKVYGNPKFEQRIGISWELPAKPLVLDHLDRAAFERYAGRMGGALAPALNGTASALFCDSWEVETQGLWANGLGEAFQSRYGYDIRPLMAHLWDPDQGGARYDYLELISHTVIENFYQPFSAMSHRLGAFSRVQCVGAPADLIDAYAGVDVPETEAMLYEPRFAGIVASAAALAGRPEVSSETFTCLYGYPREHDFEEQVADLKLVADAVIANGVNQIIWHGTPLTPHDAAHDGEFYATVHVGREGALAKELPTFNAYLEKVSRIMKRGRTYSDLAIYLPTEDAWIAGEYPKALQKPWSWGAYEMRHVRFPSETRGFHPLWINQSFLGLGRVEKGRLLVGPLSFSALYVDVEHIDSVALGTILRLAQAGLPICFKRRPGQAGRTPSPGFEPALRSLLALRNVSASLAKVLASKPLVAGANLPDYWARIDGQETFIFFAHPRSQDLQLPLSYGQSAANGPVERPVTINARGHTSRFKLVFKPQQSLLVRIDGAGKLTPLDITYEPPSPRRAATSSPKGLDQ